MYRGNPELEYTALQNELPNLTESLLFFYKKHWILTFCMVTLLTRDLIASAHVVPAVHKSCLQFPSEPRQRFFYLLSSAGLNFFADVRLVVFRSSARALTHRREVNSMSRRSRRRYEA